MDSCVHRRTFMTDKNTTFPITVAITESTNDQPETKTENHLVTHKKFKQ